MSAKNIADYFPFSFRNMLKIRLYVFLGVCASAVAFTAYAQDETVNGDLHVSGDLSLGSSGIARMPVLSSNRSPVGLETNILFNAPVRYEVTQSGPASVHLPSLFDGRFVPTYSSGAPTDTNPQVIEISLLPGYHNQVGAWFGFSTRYWPISRFKVEGYNIWNGYNQSGWQTLFDYSQNSYDKSDFLGRIPVYGAFTKLRLTIYESSMSTSHGLFGLSEIFFLHPEGNRIYSGMLPSQLWEGEQGKVGIGTKSPSHELDVAGTIRAEEIIVQAGTADYVFEEGYELRSLGEVEAHIAEHGHLPGVPSAAEVAEAGVSVGDSHRILLEKVEELTLYAIEKEKRIVELEAQNSVLEARLSRIEEYLIGESK